MRTWLGILLLVSLSPTVAGAMAPSYRLVTAEEVLAQLGPIGEPGTALFRSAAGLVFELILDPSDPAITNPIATDSFHPLPEAVVRESIEQLRPLPGGALEFTIYCLPGLPRGTLSSFCSGLEVFLAAALAEPAPAVVAYTVTHELGHVVQHRHLPGREGEGWQRYLLLRQLSDGTVYFEEASHSNRPAEIFAEDFRQLFGGELATASGSQENRDLPLATEVDGLESFLGEVLEGRWAPERTFLQVRNVPNPFNPLTTIRVQLRDSAVRAGGWVEVEIYDARGRRIRSLPPRLVAPLVSLPWDGTDGRGRPVASGRYYYTVQWGEERTYGQMLLVQ